MTTKTKTDCKTKGLCHYDSLTRTKFFHGMLLTDDHLRAEQTYHRESLKRLNRHMWGSGIVCGLEVTRTNGLCIKVQPGLALDCKGNVIDVCKCITLDLSEICKKKYPDGCVPQDGTVIKKYLVIRYGELPAEPEPVLTSDDECSGSTDGTKCEASKYREGFCLEFRDECPESDPCGEDDDESEGLVPKVLRLGATRADDAVYKLLQDRPDCVESPPCPDCGCGGDCDCDGCAVGLATLTIDCDKNEVKIECDCRRLVWSARMMRWILCGLFAKIDKMPVNVAGNQAIPSVQALDANPMQAAWDVGAVALGAQPIGHLTDELTSLRSRIAALEKAQASKGRKEQ